MAANQITKPGWWVVDWRQRPPYPILLNRFYYRQKRDAEKKAREIKSTRPHHNIRVLRRVWAYGGKRYQINVLTSRSEPITLTLTDIKANNRMARKIFGKEVMRYRRR